LFPIQPMTAEQTARTFLWGYSREHLPCCSHKCRAITHRSTFSFAKSKIVARTMASLLRFSYKLTSRPEFTNGGSRVQSSEKIRILVRHVKLAAEATARSYTYCVGFHHILRKVPDRPFYGVVFFALVPDSCPKRNTPRPLSTKPVNIE
jgi:hypothetical protein